MSNTKWTQQAVFIYLFMYVYNINNFLKAVKLKGDKGTGEGMEGRKIFFNKSRKIKT